MFSQGDSEAFLGVSISPLMDRKKAGVSKSQCGFFKVVVIPMLTSFVQAFPETAAILANLMENYEMWQKMEVTASVADALSIKPEASSIVGTNAATRPVLSEALSTEQVKKTYPA
uniref:PDEase domain-containing protein n=1 Tax=Chlamydomonas euryale TaxID=1486919 RepID=A0A7R9V3C6_9CHLO|mmetsp:Transcript_15988/g.47457  ORF Transcript_15988/g.47457 Transcript_15988/m.47457 type:complete len:115 (+) Transcript_15988:195-539(+)